MPGCGKTCALVFCVGNILSFLYLPLCSVSGFWAHHRLEKHAAAHQGCISEVFSLAWVAAESICCIAKVTWDFTLKWDKMMMVKTQPASLLLTATFASMSTLLQGSYSKDLTVMPNPYHCSLLFWALIFWSCLRIITTISVHKPSFLRRKGSEGSFLLTSFSMEIQLFSSLVHFPPHCLVLVWPLWPVSGWLSQLFCSVQTAVLGESPSLQ